MVRPADIVAEVCVAQIDAFCITVFVTGRLSVFAQCGHAMRSAWTSGDFEPQICFFVWGYLSLQHLLCFGTVILTTLHGLQDNPRLVYCLNKTMTEITVNKTSCTNRAVLPLCASIAFTWRGTGMLDGAVVLLGFDFTFGDSIRFVVSTAASREPCEMVYQQSFICPLIQDFGIS